MQPLYYSTGQVARQLGITAATVRALCENHVIAAETTPGGQWRMLASEVERLKRDGLPPIPRTLPRGRHEVDEEPFGHFGYREFVPEHSEDVVAAADQVAIARSTLERRRIEREAEENEDWFRERERREAAAKAADRERDRAKQAEQQRREWVQEWIKYALGLLPYGARQEMEIEVHSMVLKALSETQPSQPEAITKSLMEAAVHKALAPWTRKQDINRALEVCANSLPLDIRYRSEYAALKQHAWDAAVAALGKARADASYGELETAAKQATQPTIREYEHQRACQGILDCLLIAGATTAEQDAARESVRRQLAILSVDASAKQRDLVTAAALAPYKAKVGERREKARLEAEKETRRRAAEFRTDLELSHISQYLEKEYEFDDGLFGRCREADRLRPLVRKTLVAELLENPDMSGEEIRESIEEEVDDHLG
jgi:excisionase family DNA binding protein